MVLRIYNSLTRKKEDFIPLDAANIRMYVCGPTVYDHAHIGNARPVIVFDVLYRLLRHIYGVDHVKYVRNITDVDDKIMERAEAEGVSIDDLTKRTTDQFHADVAALGCLPPDIEPRATKHIGEMKTLIQTLIDKGHAYEAEGHVLFNVEAWDAYGELSGRSTDEMIAGARVEVAPYKKNPMDFVLWKPSAEDQPGWESSWGRGRPGWHIECSAMAEKHLGQVFDIHGGGVDLKFPHHENEIAQSRCAHGTGAMAKVWMHNGYLQVEGEKMSKSLGNFFTIRDLLGKWPGEVLRFNMLRTHYSQPIDWTEESTKSAELELENWVLKIDDALGSGVGSIKSHVPVSGEIIEALYEDLNTSKAISFLRRQAKEVSGNNAVAFSLLCNCEFLGIMNRRRLGLLTREFGGTAEPEKMIEAFEIYQSCRAKMHNKLPGSVAEFESKIHHIEATVSYLPNGAVEIVEEKSKETSQIKLSIEARNVARKAKDFAEADRIRNELAAEGIILKDNPDGTTDWELAQ